MFCRGHWNDSISVWCQVKGEGLPPLALHARLFSWLRELAVRRTLSFLFASAILLAGLALSIFEIIQAQNLRPFVLFGALVMVVASGAWLLYDHR